MKEKIKTSLLTISICYIIVISVLMLGNIISVKKEIIIEPNDIFATEISTYKLELAKLPEGDCKNYINDLISTFNVQNKPRKIPLREFLTNIYDDDYIGFYGKGKKACNISTEKATEYNLTNLYLSILNGEDETARIYFLQYELNIRDFWQRLGRNNHYVFDQNRSLEMRNKLAIIRTVINIVNSEVPNEE